jgi:flavin reductase (DIM6/NTAB) family NADH-FMN oxidoreductase RutF
VTVAFGPEHNAVESGTFRRIMSSFPTGVTVVTTRGADGDPVGLTANAVSSVSLAPPQLLVCLGESRHTATIIRESRKFAVSFLSYEQRWIAERFASAKHDKFSGVAVAEGSLGLPLIEGALATAECILARHMEAGDHVIFVGSVCSGKAIEGKPLMFFQREYGTWPGKGAA